MEKYKINNSITIYLVFSFALFLLLSLGVWQLNKHKVKSFNNDLLLTKTNQKPKEINNLDINIKNMEIITAKGKMLEGKSLFFEPRTYKGKIGYHKIVPFKVGNKNVLVNRGFITEKKIQTENKFERINGLIIEFPDPYFYELKNNVKNNKWYSLHFKQISDFLNIKLEPLLIYEMNNSSKEIINVLPNTIKKKVNHLNYAFTWFMLAISLSIILIIFLRKT